MSLITELCVNLTQLSPQVYIHLEDTQDVHVYQHTPNTIIIEHTDMLNKAEGR